MSKKTLTKPVPNRHPTSDDIDTFVRGGARGLTQTNSYLLTQNYR